ncbi:MAG TPA: TrkH family potassium uptake protein [Candidatus Cloacimonadota bacterium]|nr:TrkH family potassium uptake protein [Candidatus Cloacimonadota bacterium]
MNLSRKILRQVEVAAYLLAIWSFLVLFLEPIIGFYTNYARVEFFTALANLVLLLLTILNRVLLGESKERHRILLFDVAMLILGSIFLVSQAKFVIFALLIRQTYFILQYILFRAFEGKLYRWLTGNPPVTLMLSFLLVILFGAILLMLPVSSKLNTVTPFIDALFTATSATCVTGLVVVDTGTHFSFFGQMVILLLIQIGGLGIMTISTVFAIILGQRINLKLENIMYQVVGGSYAVNVFQLLKSIVLVTLVIESVGTLLLFARFAQDFQPMEALFLSLFHAVSAFCNAGFSPLGNNLVSYVDSFTVNMVITALIIAGGLGFSVIIDLQHHMLKRDRTRKLNLHTKIVLVTTAFLLVIGFTVFYLAEYNGAMQGFSIYRRILSSWFQSVTTRTAGFNTIDLSQIGKASVLISIVLMFIGASPGSTGGGIKTTSFAVLTLSVISLLKGKRHISVFKRRIHEYNFREATGLIMLSITIILVVLFFLMLVEPHAFDKLLFEAVSAFGTVGLTLGITPQLTVIGKLLITVLMYVGRIGPLTMIYAFSTRAKQININYAEEKIPIG